MRQMTPNEYKMLRDEAAVLAKSGLGAGSPERTYAIIKWGWEMGIGSMTALQGINIVSGRPAVSPQLMLALVHRSGELEDLTIDGDDKKATVTVTRVGRSPHSEHFSMADAARISAGDHKKLADKRNYQEMPAVMLKWRALAAALRVAFPDAIMGLYTTDEVGAVDLYDPETGEITDTLEDAVYPQPLDEPTEKPYDSDVMKVASETFPYSAKMPAVQQPFQEFTQAVQNWNKKFWAALGDLGISSADVHAWLNVESLYEWTGNQYGNTITHLWYEIVEHYLAEIGDAAQEPSPDAAPEQESWLEPSDAD